MPTYLYEPAAPVPPSNKPVYTLPFEPGARLIKNRVVPPNVVPFGTPKFTPCAFFGQTASPFGLPTGNVQGWAWLNMLFTTVWLGRLPIAPWTLLIQVSVPQPNAVPGA